MDALFAFETQTFIKFKFKDYIAMRELNIHIKTIYKLQQPIKTSMINLHMKLTTNSTPSLNASIKLPDKIGQLRDSHK